MKRRFSLLLFILLLPVSYFIIPVGYFIIKSAFEVREVNNLNELPFSIEDSIKIADQKGRFRNGKLFLVCENNDLLRLVYKARFPRRYQKLRNNLKQGFIVQDRITLDATLIFSSRNPYRGFQSDLSERAILQNEKGFFLSWLTTIYTEPLLGNERDSTIKFLISKTYSDISFFALETGTFFKLDREHLNERLPIFLAKCGDE